MANVNEYQPQIIWKEKLTQPILVEPFIDKTTDFDFPFKLEELPRILAYYDDGAGTDLSGYINISGIRSYSYLPVAFKKSEGEITYLDLVVKGGGAHIRPNAMHRRRDSVDDSLSEEVIPVQIVIDGKEVFVRYDYKPVVNLTDMLGAHSIKDCLSDMYMSQYLEKKGLRTRSLVAVWRLPDETIMSTPDGLLKVKEFIEKTGIEPGLDMWAMRSKYRVMDVLRFVYEVENPGCKLHPTGVYFRGYYQDTPSHRFRPEKYSEEMMTLLKGDFLFLGKEIVRRARYDSDPRFRQLGQDFKVITESTLGDFYGLYLKVFAEVLGEQFAILQNSDAISGMFNLQNISLLAEIVDHDVTMVDGKVMDEEGQLRDITERERILFKKASSSKIDDFYRQLYMGHEAVIVMLNSLSRTGIIKMSDEEMFEISEMYIKSFLVNTEDFSQALSEIAGNDFASALDQDGRLDLFGYHSHIPFMQNLRNES